MTSIILSIIIAIIIGNCIFGKNFWENRIMVLGIAAALMIVSLTSATFIARKNMPIVRKTITTDKLLPFYIPESLLRKLPYAVYKGDCCLTWTDFDATSLMRRKIDVTKTPILLDKKVKGAFQYTYKYASERKTYILLYQSGKDTLIGFIQTNGSSKELNYCNIKNLKIAPIDGHNPVIQYFIFNRKSNTNWTISWVVPRIKALTCIFIPRDEYLKLPTHIRSKCYFDGQPAYTASR